MVIKMKGKKRIAMLLALSLPLCGCAADAPAETAATESEPPRVSAAPDPAENVSPAPETEDLGSVSFKRLANTPLTFGEEVADLLWLPETLLNERIRYASETELYLPDRRPCLRSSCREMGENALSDAKKLPIDTVWADSDAEFAFQDALLRIGSIGSENAIPVESAETGYHRFFDDPHTVRGFLRQTADGAECILDPVYMDGIPLLSSREEDLTFSVNGETMHADTIAFAFEGWDFAPILDAESDRYVYAEFSLVSLSVTYNTQSGYRNTGILRGGRLLTEDTSSVLRGDFLFGQEDGSADEAARLCRSLTENFGELYDEKTCGIVLLDLDFDGTPEVLVSRAVSEEDEELFSRADVDVYRFENDSLTYLDTIRSISRSAFGENSGCSAYLGLKTLEDGSKAWFGMTGEEILDEKKGGHLDSGKLYRLENGEIREEEVFSLWQDLENGMGMTTYLGGEPVTAQKTAGESVYETVDGDPDSVTFYLNLKNQYCADIEEKIFLYSDWLLPITTLDGRRYFGTELLSPSERDIAMQLGFLTDSYYYGDYSAEDGGYVYDFYLAGAMKPVIYLYPEEKTEVSVSVDFPNGGGLTCTYPEYRDGWNVTALPDGTLFDESGNEYYCLYWEGEGLPLSDTKEGWCVPGEDTAEFLREKLLEIGLTAREANEMIIYWLPILQKNPYNRISFRFEDYCRAAPLTVSPAPDTSIRVYMAYTPLEEPVESAPQALPHYARRGFTLVEWGGGVTPRFVP